jgi:hypothetical protein
MWGVRAATGRHREPWHPVRRPWPCHWRVCGWLALPGMEEADAAALAEAEGVVSHLTSLVLVDEASEAQDAIPAQRKVALSTPRMLAAGVAPVACAPGPAGSSSAASLSAMFRGASGPMLREVTAPTSPAQVAPADETGLDIPTFHRRQSAGSDRGYREPPAGRAAPTRRRRSEQEVTPPQPPRPKRVPGASDQVDLAVARARISWGAQPERLRSGDLNDLPADVVAVLRKAAEVEGVKALAAALGVPPVVIVLALLAQGQASWDNGAWRFARALLGPADPQAVEACMRELGCDCLHRRDCRGHSAGALPRRPLRKGRRGVGVATRHPRVAAWVLSEAPAAVVAPSCLRVGRLRRRSSPDPRSSACRGRAAKTRCGGRARVLRVAREAEVRCARFMFALDAVGTFVAHGPARPATAVGSAATIRAGSAGRQSRSRAARFGRSPALVRSASSAAR